MSATYQATDGSYARITEHGIWLEDRGKYSRYAEDGEESVWVCHDCESIDADPYEGVCECEEPVDESQGGAA